MKGIWYDSQEPKDVYISKRNEKYLLNRFTQTRMLNVSDVPPAPTSKSWSDSSCAQRYEDHNKIF